LDAGPDLFHDLEIDPKEVITAHTGLALHARRDDADTCALDGLVGIGARHAAVEAVDRRGLDKIERLALRDTLGDVKQDDVAKFLETDEMSESAADLAGADQCNLGTRHVGIDPFGIDPSGWNFGTKRRP